MLNPEQLESLRRAGRAAASARDLGLSMVEAGVRLCEVADAVEEHIRGQGCGLAFPCNISLNKVAAHFTPATDDPAVFSVGDVVKVDCGAHHNGYVGDTAGTVEVGTRAYTGLIEASRDARDSVIEIIGDGTPLNEIGRLVETVLKQSGFRPVENLCGHQIEPYNLHAGLSVPNYANGDRAAVRAGMVVAVEPFATDGQGAVANGPPGNIVRLLRDRRIDDPRTAEFLDYVRSEFRTFPFCARSCDFPDAERHVKTLVRRGVLSSYAQLVEVRGGMVSQHEHTFYIDGPRAEVTTRL